MEIIKNFYYKYCLTIIVCFLIFNFFFDFIDKIKIYNDLNIFKFNRIVKVVFYLLAIIFNVIYFKEILNNLKYIFYPLLIILFLFLLKLNNWDLYFLEFLRYSFLFVVYPFVEYTAKNLKEKFASKLFSYFKLLIISNSIFILLGMIFDIEIFKTYNGNRFGFNGIILSQGMTPFVYLSAMIVFLKEKDLKMILLLLIISVLSGIKGVYFGMFLVFSFSFLLEKKITIKKKALAISVVGIVFVTIIGITFSISPFKEIIYSKGLLSALFSFRLDNFILLYEQISEYNFNLMIGVRSMMPFKVELQFVDIILFFGLIGMGSYIYFLFCFFRVNIYEKFGITFFVSILLLAMLSGNLFYNPISSVFFLIVLFSLKFGEFNKGDITKVK